jgi:hypothetical protein
VVSRLAGVRAKHSGVLRGHHLQPGDRVRSRLLLDPSAVRSGAPAGPIRANGLVPAAAFIDRNPRYQLARPTIEALQAFYSRMTHKEKPIYLYHALLLMLRRNEIDWTSQPPEVDTPMAEVERLYADHLQGGRMEMDEYIMDLHTRKMKWRPGCLESFAREGALVKNEDSRLITPAYREIYVHLKQELDRYHAHGGRLQ